MSYFFVASGREVGELDLAAREISLGLLTRAATGQFHLVEPDLRLHVVATSASAGSIYDGTKFDRGAEEALVAVFGHCTEVRAGQLRRFDRDSARKVIDDLRRGDCDTPQLDGNFTLIAYSRESGRVLVTGSRFSWYPIHYGSDARRAVISSRSALLADLLQSGIDGIAYASMLRGLALPPERSLFARVHTRLPHEHFVVTRGSASLESRLRPLREVEDGRDLVNRAMEEVSSIILRACEEPRSVVDLTGGQDTRVTAAVLSQNPQVVKDHELTFKTSGAEDTPDVVIARRIAQMLGWNHMVVARDYPVPYSWDRFELVSWLNDGATVPDDYAVRSFFREAEMAHRFENLVGSWGCEFLRDHFFLPEYILRAMGRGKSMPGHFMTRARPNNRIDLARVTGGVLTLAAHDEHHLATYAKYWEHGDRTLANRLNTMAMVRTMQKNRAFWAYATFRKTSLPYVTDRFYSLALALRLRTKVMNRFIAKLIARGDPRLASLLTDRGATLRPIKLTTVGCHGAYYAKELKRMVAARLQARCPESKEGPAPLPESWRDQLDFSRPFYEYSAPVRQRELTHDSHREWLCLLMLESLHRHYRHIRRELEFAPAN